MAMQVQFRCERCDHRVEAWDDGNPYYLDDRGRKQYAHHPQHDLLARCVGNDTPHLCLGCAETFMLDSRAPRESCPRCDSAEIVDLMVLDGCRCPWCSAGVLRQQPGFTAIS